MSSSRSDVVSQSVHLTVVLPLVTFFLSNILFKELKGFKKISILKGDSKEINIFIEVDKLAFYDETISNWNIEKGDYMIYVGNASDNISKELKITII